MNFLAHAALAGPDPDWQVGGMIADFSRPPDTGDFGPAIRAGIHLHRKIDGFTDRHPLVMRSRHRMSAQYRRASGILVDVFYDHFLARTWQEYFPATSLAAFSQQFYTALQGRDAVLPPYMKPLVTRMIEQDWLGGYREPEQVSYAVDRIARRLSRPEILTGGGMELERCYEGLAEDFKAFFPQAVTFAEAQRGLSGGLTA